MFWNVLERFDDDIGNKNKCIWFMIFNDISFKLMHMVHIKSIIDIFLLFFNLRNFLSTQSVNQRQQRLRHSVAPGPGTIIFVNPNDHPGIGTPGGTRGDDEDDTESVVVGG